jgi:RND family efflux transporter MFP subunit
VTAKEPRTIEAGFALVQELDEPGGFTAHGTVRPLLTSTLSSKAMGKVLTINVREGDFVRRGQLLLTIDTREQAAAASVAAANLNASVTGVGSAKTAVEIESKTSQAAIRRAESQVSQAQAALASARANLDLVLAGPRKQEVSQTSIAVAQAESSLRLAKTELDRTKRLVESGALAQRDLDVAQNRYDLALGQFEAAKQSESLAKEGSRSEEIKGAQQMVAQAEAGLKTAQSGLEQARAAALQVSLRKNEVQQANAGVRQASAALNAAQVSLSHGRVVAPFDGRITHRFLDPGAMASPGLPLLTIAGGTFRLEASVPESILPSVKLGESAPISIEVLGEETVIGKAVEIVPAGDSQTRNFAVRFELPDSPLLKTGLFGRVVIPNGRMKGLAIPTSATWEREGLHYVYALDSQGMARLRIITIGETIGERVIVLSGLKAGERIVTTNQTEVRDGDKIQGAGQ